MADSKIEWTDKSWNIISGCTKVSPGCDNCYAIGMSRRLQSMEGKVGEKYSGTVEGDNWTGKVTCHEDLLELPLRWKKPSRIFVNSMSDLFHDDVPVTFIKEVLQTILLCPQHIFQVLTKRPMRMSVVMRSIYASSMTTDAKGLVPLTTIPNLWLGVSCENRPMWDQRIHHLKRTPAAVRFVSYEPALGDLGKVDLEGINWIIAGGESGPNARPSHPDWFRSLRDQCVVAGVPYFFKQHGQWLHESEVTGLPLTTDERATFFQENLGRLPECFLSSDCKNMWFKVGKKQAGRLLDGIEWNEYPNMKGIEHD